MHDNVQAFLDQRGEDFEADTQRTELVLLHFEVLYHQDDVEVDRLACQSALDSSIAEGLLVMQMLQVAKAQECEANTGPAGQPPAAAGAAAEEEVRHATVSCNVFLYTRRMTSLVFWVVHDARYQALTDGLTAHFTGG